MGKERKGVSLKEFYSRKEASWEAHAEVHEYLPSCACLCVCVCVCVCERERERDRDRERERDKKEEEEKKQWGRGMRKVQR